MSTSIRNSQVEELIRQLAREVNISLEQAEEIWSLRFKYLRDSMSSTTHDEIIEKGTVKTIRWMGLGEFYPNKKRITDYIKKRRKKDESV